ncbi:uncharacterized protein [Macrobrachium rosenbergii]|uniref:uncharacterized protein n=1 Tax=Macrobrachium rosenbergii TaxID=79674 RepID=UPI0034D5E2A6
MDIRMSAFPVNSCGNSGYFMGKGAMPSAGPQVTLDMNSHPPVLDTASKIPPQKTSTSSCRGAGKFGGQWLASIRNMYNSIKSCGPPVTWVNPDLVPQYEPRPVHQASPLVMPLPFPETCVMETQNSPLWYQAPPGCQYYYQDPLHIYNMVTQSYPSEVIPSQKNGIKRSSQPLNPEAKEWVPDSFKSNKDMSSNPPCSLFSPNVQNPLVITTAVSVGFVEITEKEISEVRETMKNEMPKMWNASVENSDVKKNNTKEMETSHAMGDANKSNTKKVETSNAVGKSSGDSIQNVKCCMPSNTECKLKCEDTGMEHLKDTLTYASIARKSPEPPQKSTLVGDTDTSPCDMVKQPIPKIFTKDKNTPKRKPPCMENKQREPLPFRTGSRTQKRSSRKFLKDLKEHSPAKSDCSFTESGSSIDSNSDILSRLSLSGSPSSSTWPLSMSPRDKTMFSSSPRDGKSVRSLSESSGNSSHNRTTSESSTGSGESVDIEFNDEDCVTEDGQENISDVDKMAKSKHPNSILAHILGLDSDSEESEEETDDDWDDVDGECTTIVLDDSWETFGLVFQPTAKLPSSSTKSSGGVDCCSEANISKFENICDNNFNENCNSNLEDVNRRWESHVRKDVKTASPCRVQFGETVVHPMIAWTFAYKNARRGPWEQCARDRVRFNSRIEALEPVISSVLEGSHREAMYQKIYGS